MQNCVKCGRPASQAYSVYSYHIDQRRTSGLGTSYTLSSPYKRTHALCSRCAFGPLYVIAGSVGSASLALLVMVLLSSVEDAGNLLVLFGLVAVVCLIVIAAGLIGAANDAQAPDDLGEKALAGHLARTEPTLRFYTQKNYEKLRR